MTGHQLRNKLGGKLKKAGKKTGKCLQTAAWQSCKCVLWTCCTPCICLGMLCLPRRRGHCKTPRDPFEFATPPVPFPRQRALTIPSTDWREDQSILDQLQSPFLSKLPLEIRRMVYQYALGGTSIHLTTTDGALVARRCDLPECLCGIFSTAQGRKLAFALPMLRTCRQVYSEAIEYLYTDNSFSLSTDIDEIPTIDYFSHFFLPQRLTQIRDLFFYWELDSFNYHLMTQTPNPVLDQWYKSWGALGKLSGLRRLRVSLVFRYTHWSDYYEELWKERWVEMLEPLKTITAPRDFVVTLPDRRCSTAIDLGESHCVFELPAAVEDDDSTDDDSL